MGDLQTPLPGITSTPATAAEETGAGAVVSGQPGVHTQPTYDPSILI